MPCTRNLFLAVPIRFNGWSPKVSKGRSESPLVASAEAKSLAKQKEARKLLPLPCTRNLFLAVPIRFNRWSPKVSKGRPESPLVASAEAKSSAKQKEARKLLPLPCTRNLFLAAPIRFNGWSPKVSKGRPESPLVASAEAKPSAKQKKESKLLSLASHKKSVSCERFRPPAGGRGTFPTRESTQRAPGAAKGCMRRGRPRTPRC